MVLKIRESPSLLLAEAKRQVGLSICGLSPFVGHQAFLLDDRAAGDPHPGKINDL
ncbi:MAG: hypothetical protein JO122_20975 [Acetobacteraceae bacterium]|nr:hypothetical protein [Acetobacteraceae bacterium]